MKRIILCLITLVVAVLVTGNGAVQAAIVTFNTFDANGTQSSGFTITPSAPGDPTTYSFTRTANLDGGTIDDTLSFDFVYTMYTGSSFDGTNVTLGTSVALASLGNSHYMNNYVGDGNTNFVSAGDSFTASITNISYTSGEGFNVPAVSFDGFNSLSKFGNGAADIYVGTDSAVTKTVGSGNGPITLDGVTDLAITTALTTGDSNQRWRDLNFSFTVPDATAVPEPSSFALLGIGLAGFAVRRRRK